jgi:hypothetical protein
LATPSFGLIRQVFLDLWLLENPDFAGVFLYFSYALALTSEVVCITEI